MTPPKQIANLLFFTAKKSKLVGARPDALEVQPTPNRDHWRLPSGMTLQSLSYHPSASAEPTKTIETRCSGQSKWPEYNCWQHMKRRCLDPRSTYYGARGITVCQEWQDSFQAFIEHIGRRPSPKHSIERKDVNGNYEPGNVEWATPKTQGRNRRNNVLLEYKGETLCVSEWAERLGIPWYIIGHRLRWGWSTEKALETPHVKFSNYTRRAPAVMENHRFGRLVVIQRDGTLYPTKYVCQCDCGRTVSVRQTNLVAGRSKSCGCVNAERAAR